MRQKIDFVNTSETYLSLKSFSDTVCVTEAHLQPCQVYAIEFFPKINGCFYLLNILAKSSIVDVSHHSK